MFSDFIDNYNDPDKIKIVHSCEREILVQNTMRFTIVLLSGEGEVSLNFESTQLSGNYIFFLCPGEVLEISKYRNVGVISFDENSSLKRDKGFCYTFGNIQKCFELTQEIFDQLFQLVDKIEYSLKSKNIEERQSAKKILGRIFELSPSYIGEKEAKEQHLVYDFICLVHEHYTMQHEVPYYAKFLNTTAKRITEKFNEMGVLNPHGFIKKRIVIEAKRQLLFTDKNIKTICFDLGFNDPAYFARFFKKNVGLTAKEYRISSRSRRI